ncbi:MAG TPA: thiamine pyrophosphate-dependent enzyme, partial [Paracoccaceae bacterium]|nr:thiamine pyrophosphate-dependent enzyme [Paracoccaceae bacterium]
MPDTISHLLCRGLIAAGVDALYCLPGVQNDDFFNVLVDFPELRPIVTRHEQGASYMAAGAAQATGRPAAYCVVPGQGVLNAAAGHSTALATGGRVFALIGQNRTNLIEAGHGLLHEIPDQLSILARISKHAVALRDPAQAPGQIAEAFHRLASGHPAPVTVECPLNLWTAPAEGQPTPEPEFPALDTDAIERAAALLAGAERPLIMLGGGAHGAADSIAELVEMLGAPVAALRQGKGAYDERKPLAVPGPVAYKLYAQADVVLGIGTRLQTQEMMWGVDDALALIQITADPAEAGRRGKAAVAIKAMAEDAVPALVRALEGRLGRRPDRIEELAGMKAELARDTEHLPQVAHLKVLREEMGEDDVFLDDLTQVSFAARFAFPVAKPRGYLSAAYAGTLGWGLPGGLGAQIARPDVRVVNVQGDGGFMYAANELATAVKYNVPLVTVVYNDNAYGNVQRIQTDRFGHNRTIASDLTNPDIVKFAESFGAMGLRAGTPEELRAALRQAFLAGGPAVIEVPVPE